MPNTPFSFLCFFLALSSYSFFFVGPSTFGYPWTLVPNLTFFLPEFSHPGFCLLKALLKGVVGVGENGGLILSKVAYGSGMSRGLEIQNLVLADFHECLSYPGNFESSQRIRTLFMKGMQWDGNGNGIVCCLGL